VGAIESDGWATIDEKECTLCGQCVPVCPNDAISLGVPLKEPEREYESEYDVVIIGAGDLIPIGVRRLLQYLECSV